MTAKVLYLSWNPPAIEYQNGIIRSYVIRVTEQSTATLFQFTSFVTEFFIYSLHPYYLYNLSIAAVTVDTGPFSDPAVVRTLETGKS